MAASGRYKSRLLNYLVERSQKLSDQAGQRLRQARTGVVWGVQILLYPLYAAFQTSRLVGRRLRQGGARPGQARLTPPQADEAVNAVIQLARTLADDGAITVSNEVGLSKAVSLEASLSKLGTGQSANQGSSELELTGRELGRLEPASPDLVALAPAQVEPAAASIAVAAHPGSLQPSHSSSDSLAPTSRNMAPASGLSGILGGVDIRGVASELSDRALVLVDNNNRTVPLEAEQQWTLQQTIVQQLADYNYRRQRYSQQLALGEAHDRRGLLRDRALPLPQPRPRQLSGFRWMTHLMGWMQTSRLAQTANLFQESQLAIQVAPPPFLYWDPEPGQQLTRQTLAQLDAPLATLEQRYVQSEVPERRPDPATQVLRFTAKLFGLEEAAARWLSETASPAPSAGPSNPSDASSGLAIPALDRFGPNAITAPATDPWEKALSQQLPDAYNLSEPSPLSAGSRPPGLGTGQGPDIVQPIERSPKGWQRLTTRFGGLIKALRPPAGPIAPLNSPGNQVAQPPVAAPTNANMGLSGDARQSGDVRQPVNTQHPSPKNPHSTAPGGLLHQAAERSGLRKATKDEAKSKNVTSRRRWRGGPLPLTSSEPAINENEATSADSSLRQTAETTVTYESPYIETTAQFSGYERHPLEIVLSRLDQILLWIEEQGLRLWQWLTTPRQQ